MDHADIRRFLVDEVVNNPWDYQCFVDNINEWADAMKQDGTWADGIALKATANCLHIPVVVFRKRNPNQSPTLFLPRVYDDSVTDEEPICVELDESCAGGEHYSPLVQNKSSTPVRRKRDTQPATNDDCAPVKSARLDACVAE